MRIAFLSDIHANLPALEAALAQAVSRGGDRVVVAGDVVGDGPHPAEAVDLLREHSEAVIRGNVDREVLEQGWNRSELESSLRNGSDPRRANRAWTALRLELGQRRWLEELGENHAFEVGPHRVLVVHGSPRSDTEYIHPDISSDELEARLDGVDPRPRVLVCGHSHEPFVREIDGILVVNCGSVGRPTDGNPWGSFAVVDFFEDSAPTGRIVRFPYPVQRVVRDLEDRGVPGVSGWEYVEGRKGQELAR